MQMVRYRQLIVNLLVLLLPLLVASCGGGSTAVTPTPAAPTPTAATTPRFQHVFVVVLENQNYSDVLNNPAMPYFNSLARQYGLATQYFANAHPSIGNYFMMTTGQIISNDNNFGGTVDADNVVRRLNAAGQSWRVYAQSLPSVGYIGGDQGAYVKHHNPVAYLSDVVNSVAQQANMVPLAQLQSDIAAGTLPNYGFVVPDDLHNSHDCPGGVATCSNADKLAAADQWLQATVAPLLAASAFSNGLVVITFDESATDNTSGGGRVATIIAGGRCRRGFSSSNAYQHAHLLHVILRELGMDTSLAAATAASGMEEFVEN